jgi:hypothetical protein
VAVEKLFSTKFAKIKLRQEALQSIFSGRLDIFYPPNFGCFEKNGLFQQPRLISPTTRVLCASVVGFDGCFPGRDSHPFDGLSSAIEH